MFKYKTLLACFGDIAIKIWFKMTRERNKKRRTFSVWAIKDPMSAAVRRARGGCDPWTR